MSTLSIEFTEIGKDFIVCKMPVNNKVHQPDGILHGGATAALAETVGSVASRYFINDDSVSVRGMKSQQIMLEASAMDLFLQRLLVYIWEEPCKFGKSKLLMKRII